MTIDARCRIDMTTRAPLLVAKIGGSLHDSPNLARWIDALKRWPHRLTLVCGGGPFADAVRATQPTLGFSEGAAHAMAILAMEQYALALSDLYGVALAATREEIDAAHRRGQIALWRPSNMVADAADIPPGWNVTSDSLAAWLAQQTGADALLMIKSVDIGADSALECIVSAGIVDAAFHDYVDGMPVYVAGPRALAHAGALMARGTPPGALVASATQKIAS